MDPEQQPMQEEEPITPQTVEQFNRVCQQATELMLSYKQQSADLKNQISSMVNIYNKNADPSSAVPVQKIIQITNQYETEMKNAHKEYEHLQEELKKQENERNQMVKDIYDCFAKLERLEQKLKAKKQKQAKLAQEGQTQKVKAPQQDEKKIEE